MADMKDDGCEDAYWLKRRHEYAGLAMQGLLANHHNFDFAVQDPSQNAYWARHYADALIAELKKE